MKMSSPNPTIVVTAEPQLAESPENRVPGPIFIVGNARSGTTLMARILRRHPDVYILNETHFYDEYWRERERFSELGEADLADLIRRMITVQRKDYYRKHEIENYDDEVSAIHTEFRKRPRQDFTALMDVFLTFEAARHGRRIAGDQTPRLVFVIPKLLEMFPRARIINMVRDPRGVLLSQKNRWKMVEKHDLPAFETWRTRVNYHPITMSLLWNRGTEAALDAIHAVHHAEDHIRTVVFEKLVENGVEEVKGICSFIGLKFYDDMLDISVEMTSNLTAEGERGLNAQITDTWKMKLSPTEIFISQWLTRKHITHFGYKEIPVTPNPLLLAWQFFIWPLQLAIAFTLNLGRMGNPLEFFRQRLMR